MSTVKIQINHQANITIKNLVTILYDQIGEEYDLSEEDIEDIVDIENSFVLPNNTFITVLSIVFDELAINQAELKTIVRSNFL